QSSAIRTGYANERPSGSEEGVASNHDPYSDLIEVLRKASIDGSRVYHGIWPTAKWGERPMTNHSVTLRVTPFLSIECKFWLTDDGWNGSCERPSITVQAGRFEHAKSEMEMAL